MPIEVATARLANGLTLSYAMHGSPSGPAVVMHPGPTDSWWSYQPVLEQLPASIRAFAVSPRGHGDSDRPPTGYRIEDFAADVVPFLDAVGVEEPAVLIGHSGSALVVRRVAVDAPERVAGLVLEASPVTLCGHPGLESLVRSVVAGLEDPIDPAFARSVVVDTSSDQVSPQLVERFVAELQKVPARVWHEMFDDLLLYDDRDRLSRIAAPTLLIWGDADGLLGSEVQDDLARRIPGAQLVTYAGVGHTPRWEDPARFASDVAAFVHGTTGGPRGRTGR